MNSAGSSLTATLRLEPRVEGEINFAHPAAPEQFEQLVGADLARHKRFGIGFALSFGERPVCKRSGRDLNGGRFDEVRIRVVVSQQLCDFAAQFRVARARFIQESVTRRRFAFQCRVIQPFDPFPTLTLHACASALNFRRSQERAMRQSRFTVSGETLSAVAVSSSVKPPKKRISTTCALRASTSDNALNASSIATKLSSCPWLTISEVRAKIMLSEQVKLSGGL